MHTPTVFILISRSFLTRNILRSGTLTHLKKRGYRIVVFFQASKVPQYLRDEFEDAHVTLHAYDTSMRPLHRRVNRFKRYLIDTHTTRSVARFDTKKKIMRADGTVSSPKKSPLNILFAFFLISTFGRISFIRRVFRYAERHFFPQQLDIVSKYFEQYRPNAVLSTSLISGFDVLFLKEAGRRAVPTISMPKGWDNVTKEYYPYLPDWFAAPNDITKRLAVTLQDMPPSRVRTVGLPQFDWYSRPEIRRTRLAHWGAKGLEPDRKVIFFGSEGAWSQNDWRIAEQLYEWVRTDAFVVPAQLFVRPHYSDVQSPKFDVLRGKLHVFVDDYPKVDFLADKWDPTVEQTIDFTNSILHADVVVNIASSLALDGAAADRPVVLIGYGCEFEEERDVTIPKLYGSDHMRWVAATGGAALAETSEALRMLVSEALEDPSKRSKGRARLREELCYKIDGKSSERLADLVAEAVQSAL